MLVMAGNRPEPLRDFLRAGAGVPSFVHKARRIFTARKNAGDVSESGPAQSPVRKGGARHDILGRLIHDKWEERAV